MSSYTRVYLEGGTVTHLLDYHLSPNQPNASLCGRQPWGLGELWHGTGSQEEEERALDLKECVRCFAVASHRAGGMLER